MAASPFRFDLEKAIQATAVILREQVGHRINYMKLLKLVSIAEREALKETGRMIVGDTIVAMKRGPLPSRMYDLLKGEHVDLQAWSEYIGRDKYDAYLTKQPGVARLSRFEIEKLQEVARRHVNDDEWTMVEITHTFGEWIKNAPQNASSQKIPIEDILEAVGRAAETEEILREAQQQRLMSDFFVRHGACSKETPS